MKIYRLPPNAEALILDIDGTLYDNPAWMEEQNDILIRRYARERGKDAQEARTIVSGAKILASRDGGTTSLANALAYLGIPIETSVAWRQELLEPEAWLSPDPALAGCLRSLAASFRLIALTNNPSDIGQRSLAALGLEGIMEEVIGLERSLRSKPDPAPFRLALERLGLPPESVISLGDRFEIDLAVPLDMGMGAVHVDGPGDIIQLAGVLLAGRRPRPQQEKEHEAKQEKKTEEDITQRRQERKERNEGEVKEVGSGEKELGPPPAKPRAIAEPPSRHAERRDAFKLLAILPTLLILAVLAAGIVRWSLPSTDISLLEQATDRMDPRTVLGAFHSAYPERIGKPHQDAETGDWRIAVDGKEFSWARGRLLPPTEAGDWDAYRPYISYNYPWRTADPASYPEELVQRLESLAQTQADALETHGGFAEALYGGLDEDSVWRRQVRTKFLGWRVTMHEMAVYPLARVEREILLAAKYSSEVRRYVESIGEVGGYHWRTIRGQKALSYHSFGMAIDILPTRKSKRGIYWQWEMEAGEDWIRYPLSKRWSPPEEVIRAFEGNGFCWGGRWPMYDTMHFEYRPELIELRSRVLPWYLSLRG